MYCAQKRKGLINLLYKYNKVSKKNVYIYLEVVNTSLCMSLHLSQQMITHYSAEQCINTTKFPWSQKHMAKGNTWSQTEAKGQLLGNHTNQSDRWLSM